MYECGSQTGVNIDLLTGEVAAGTVWCKSWKCEHCAVLRSKQLQAQAAGGYPNKFITLTSKLRPDSMTVDEAARQLVHAWRMAIQRGKRDGIFKDIQYLAVFELTKNGWPHIHILARCEFLPKSWLSKRMAEYADSPIVDIRKVTSRRRAAWYVAKYTSKAPEKFQGCKRYWRTRRYTLTDVKKMKVSREGKKGYIYPDYIEYHASFLERNGYKLTWTSDHSTIATPGPEDVYHYLRRPFLLKRKSAYGKIRQ